MSDTTALARLTQSPAAGPLARSFDEMLAIGKTLLDSGFLPGGIKSPAQAVAIILKGRELGIPEMQSLCSINVIQGKTALAAELQLALARRSGVTAKILESSDKSCTIRFSRPGQDAHTETFTMEDAKRLGLDRKENYLKQPATMLRWRCVSAGLRFYASDALAGMVYTPEELGAAVNEDGAVIEFEPEPPALEVEPEPEPPANGRYVAAMLAERDRVGRANYMAALGIAGFTAAEEILDRDRQKEVFRALKALPTASKATRVKDKVSDAVAPREREPGEEDLL